MALPVYIVQVQGCGYFVRHASSKGVQYVTVHHVCVLPFAFATAHALDLVVLRRDNQHRCLTTPLRTVGFTRWPVVAHPIDSTEQRRLPLISGTYDRVYTTAQLNACVLMGLEVIDYR